MVESARDQVFVLDVRRRNNQVNTASPWVVHPCVGYTDHDSGQLRRQRLTARLRDAVASRRFHEQRGCVRNGDRRTSDTTIQTKCAAD